jgi:hypothetical protein
MVIYYQRRVVYQAVCISYISTSCRLKHPQHEKSKVNVPFPFPFSLSTSPHTIPGPVCRQIKGKKRRITGKSSRDLLVEPPRKPEGSPRRHRLVAGEPALVFPGRVTAWCGGSCKA